MRLRSIQAGLLILLVTAGVVIYRQAPRPGPELLADFADEELARIFSPDVRHGGVDLDLADGIVIHDLVVPARPGVPPVEGAMGPVPAFSARQITIRHSVVALTAGTYRPTEIEIDGASCWLTETEEGLEADFPLDLPEGKGDGRVPTIRIRNARLAFRGRAGSERLAPGAVLIFEVPRLDVLPEPDGQVRIRGDLVPANLGTPDSTLELAGLADPTHDSFHMRLAWEALEINPVLISKLAPPVARQLEEGGIRSGNLTIRVQREPEKEAVLEVDLDGDMSLPQAISGTRALAEDTRKQLGELFGDAVLDVGLLEDRVVVRSLHTRLGGGILEAAGWVEQDTGELELRFSVRDLDLTSPDIPRALGAEGAAILTEFEASGRVDADGVVTRGKDGELEWRVNVILEDVSFRYLGTTDEDGIKYGFPYLIERAYGSLRIEPRGVFFDQVNGFNRGVEARVRGYKQQAWRGGETGRIYFTDQGTDLRLTVEVFDMPVDERLRAAVEGSEFAGLLDEFQLGGVIDRTEIDIVREPGIDSAAVTQVRLSLDGESFKYSPFPLPLEDVRGTITLTRPKGMRSEGNGRGKIFEFDASGWADGSSINLSGKIADHLDTGWIEVMAYDIPLQGVLAETIQKAALAPADLAETWRWLSPEGSALVLAELPVGKKNTEELRLRVEMNGARIQLDAEGPHPLEMEDLRGTLRVRDGVIHLDQVSGRFGGAPVKIEGQLEGGAGGSWQLAVKTETFELTEEILAGFQQLTGGGELLPAGAALESGSRVALDLAITRRPGADSPIESRVQLEDLKGQLRLASGKQLLIEAEALSLVGGVIAVRRGEITYDRIQVTVPQARIPLPEEHTGDQSLSGRFILAMDAFRVSEDILGLLPPSTAQLLTEWFGDRQLSSAELAIDAPPTGPIRLEGDLSLVVPPDTRIGEMPRGTITLSPLVLQPGAQGVAHLSGRIRLQGVSADIGPGFEGINGELRIDQLRLDAPRAARGRLVGISGRIAGLEVEALDTPVLWEQEVLRLQPITARIAEGSLRGHLQMRTADPTMYEGGLEVRNFSVARLRDQLAPTGPRLSGRGLVQFVFQNRGGGIESLTGAGTLQVRNGALGQLPGVANIFALMSEVLNDPQGPEFQRADVRFRLQDEVVTFDEILLAGPLFEMPGKGTMDLSGTVDLTFQPEFIKSLVLPGVMQVPALGDILGALLREDALYAVRLKGDLSTAEPQIIPFPWSGVDLGSDYEGAPPPALPRRRVPRWFR